MENVDGTAGKPGLEIADAWFGSQEQLAFGRRLAEAPRSVLLLDYDGTLAPFAIDKMQAWPYPGVAEALRMLYMMPGVRLVLVTGRRAMELESLLDLAKNLEIWGSHGREHIGVDRQYTVHPVSEQQRILLDGIVNHVEQALVHVPLHREDGGAVSSISEQIERKPGSVAVHWRGLEEASRARVQDAAAAADPTRDSDLIQRLSFASGVEFRATGYTKAVAIQKVLEQSAAGDVLAYLGDDLTDEDAFAALGQAGLSLLVGPNSRKTQAQYWLLPPVDLLRFFQDWQHAAQSDSASVQPR